jgi:ATPase family AAA domain-containing protein 1
MLHDTPLSPSLSLRTLAERAEGLSGSDLKELCRGAAMIAVRERMSMLEQEIARSGGNRSTSGVGVGGGVGDDSMREALSKGLDRFELRPLTFEDFTRSGEHFLATMSNGTQRDSALQMQTGDLNGVDDVPVVNGIHPDRSRIDEVKADEPGEEEHTLD